MTGPRVFAAFLATALAAVAAASGAHAQTEPTIDRGVVQTVEQQRLVLRALDGTDLAFAVDPRTRVLLNGLRTRLGAIRPGYVAEVAHHDAGRAARIRASGRFARVERGVVVSLEQRQLVLEAAGGQLSIPVTRATRVRRGSFPAARRAVQPGRSVTVRLTANGTARVIVVARRRT